MAIPHSTTGSLGPAFASARLVGLTVSLAYIHGVDTRLPTGLSQTSDSPVTLWQDAAPVTLTGCQCPSPRLMGLEASLSRTQGWYFIDDSVRPEVVTSQSPPY